MLFLKCLGILAGLFFGVFFFVLTIGSCLAAQEVWSDADLSEKTLGMAYVAGSMIACAACMSLIWVCV